MSLGLAPRYPLRHRRGTETPRSRANQGVGPSGTHTACRHFSWTRPGPDGFLGCQGAPHVPGAVGDLPQRAPQRLDPDGWLMRLSSRADITSNENRDTPESSSRSGSRSKSWRTPSHHNTDRGVRGESYSPLTRAFEMGVHFLLLLECAQHTLTATDPGSKRLREGLINSAYSMAACRISQISDACLCVNGN